MGENVSLIDGHIDGSDRCVICGRDIPEGSQYCVICGKVPSKVQTNYDRIRNMSVEEVVYCKNCKHLMFSDFYGECSKGYMGIVSPNDYCSKGERKEDNK